MLLVLVLGVGASFAADSNQTDLQASDDTGTVVSISETDTVSIDENTTIINVDGDSSEKLTATGDRDELQTLIEDNYGNEISLDKDYLFTSGTNHAGIAIASPITINGNGHIIDAAQTGRIFQITAQNVILKNITLQNGKINGHGGLILWNAKYGTLDCCTLYNGDSTASGGRGGAIYFQQGYGTILDCTFEKNKFSGNGRGGALYIASGHMIIDHTTFKENTALVGDGDGGAIWLAGGYSNITYCLFDSNADVDASFDVHIPSGTQYYFYGNTFKNGYGRGSGDNDGSSVGLIGVSYATFDNNKWINGHAYSGVSGGLYVRNSCNNIYVINNEFHNNTARNYGGAISVFGSGTVTNIVIRNNTFVNNTASYGGAIALPTTASSMTIEDCKFINNMATEQSGFSSNLTGSGGAIYANCYTTLINCEFSGNNATNGSGGAIYTTHTCTIKNTNFTNNVAAVNGGAIYDGTTDTSLTFAIGNVSFVNNKATENGGALYIADGATVTLDNYYCSGNTAATNPDIKTDGIIITVLSMYVKVGQNGDGLSTNTPTNWTYALANVANEGTIYLMSGLEYDLIGLTISGKAVTVQGYDNNVVFNANRAGPVFTVSVAGVTIRNIHFKNAYRAGNGAAITWTGYYGLLQDCTFENCESYATSNNGAVYWSGNGGTVDNCTFINNKATGTNSPDAGALTWTATDGIIKNSYFKNNTGLNDGGALLISGSSITNLEIYNCNFVENKAQTTSGHGGAISVWIGTNVKIYNCNFTKNTAESGLGGAVYWGASSPSGNLYDCNFDQNTAVNGGAVYWTGATGSLSSSNFTSNVATEKGGAIYWNTNDGTITSSNFNSNRAVNGSAIYLSPSVTEFELKYDKFTSNVASGYGTVAAEQLTDLSIGGNTFTSNIVSSGAADYYFYGHIPENITSALVYVSPSGSASSLGMTSDSPTTFDHALEIIEEGGKIVLLNGEYSNIVEKTISQSIAIVGSGSTVLLGGNKKFFTITANGVIIENITFKNGKVTGNGGAITWSGANGQVIGSTFTNNVATGNGGALYWTGTGGKIDSSTFESNTASSGNNLYSTNTVSVTNSVLKDHFTLTKTGTISYGTDEVIGGTFASNAPSSITLYLGTTSQGSVSVSSNTFSKTLSLLPVGTYTISFKDANSNTYTFTDNSFAVNRLSTVYISPSGTGSGNSASSPTTWDKVANIITSTGTVIFATGIYSDFYGKTINQGWTLQAASGATPVLDANNKGRIFTVSANNVKIDGLTFKNGKVSDSYGSAIHWTGTGGTLTNSVLTENTGRPVTATTTLTMTNNQLKDQITLTKSNIDWAGTETITGTFAHNAPSTVNILFNGTSQGSYSVSSGKVTASYAFTNPSTRSVGSYVVTDQKK
ncbi:MAG: hypothetical protein IJG19_05765 [Methanobrevibacter sp.]|nr:hypothetical protein [Methanobrevibacter sp.]